MPNPVERDIIYDLPKIIELVFREYGAVWVDPVAAKMTPREKWFRQMRMNMTKSMKTPGGVDLHNENSSGESKYIGADPVSFQ